MAKQNPDPAQNLSADAVYVPTGNDFAYVCPDVEKREGMIRPSIGFWKDALMRLRKNRMAAVCLIILTLIVLGAIVIPLFSPYTTSEQHVSHANRGFFYTDPADGHRHIFGTDYLGRDLFVRVWDGARVSLLIAVIAVAINLVIGLLYGGISGYFGGALDTVMMRIVEIVSGIPYLIIVIILMMVLPRGMISIIAAYGIVGWTGMARLVRGQIVALKEREFIAAAEAMGARGVRIILRHLLPNTLSVIIVNITLAIPNVIFSESFLSFVGIGLPPPQPSWGVLASEGQKMFQMYPSQLIVPSVFICLTMLSFNLLGDAMRDAFDPKLRR